VQPKPALLLTFSSKKKTARPVPLSLRSNFLFNQEAAGSMVDVMVV